MTKKALAATLALALPLGSGPAAAATTFVVSPTGTDSPTCGATTAPCKTVQFAIDLTASGDTVLVQSGTYAECIFVIPGSGLGSISVLAEAYVNNDLAGGATLDGETPCGTESAAPGPVAIVYDKSRLGGFAIKNGGDSGVWGLGAVTLVKNIITDNATTSVGGGVYLEMGANLSDPLAKASITENRIVDNVAGFDGAGIFVDGTADGVTSLVELDGNTLQTNTAGGSVGAFGAGITVFTDTASATDVSSVVITNNTVDGNTAKNSVGEFAYGAGIFVATGSSAGLGTETITVGTEDGGNLVRNNVSEGLGGGLSANLQPAAGAQHTIEVQDNIVTANTAAFAGGGIHAFAVGIDLDPTDPARLEVRGNTVNGNVTEGDTADPLVPGGGGVFAETYAYRTPAGALALEIAGNSLHGNVATSRGGGASLLAFASDDPNADGAVGASEARIGFENNLVAASNPVDPLDPDRPSGEGGGVFVRAEALGGLALASVDHDFLTVADNTDDAGVGGLLWSAQVFQNSLGEDGQAQIELTNSIIQGNSGIGVDTLAGVPPAGVTLDIRYNDAFPADWGGGVAGDVDASNIAVDAELDALFIAPLCSPTIDAGDPSILAGGLEPLPNGGRVNLGQFGNTTDATRTFPDVNADGFIDGLDILGVAVSFNSEADPPDPRFIPAADRDLDGDVDGDDLSYVAAFYARSCP